MNIQFNAFIPQSLGAPLTHFQLPYAVRNKEELEFKLSMIPGSWIKEPFSDLIFCKTDDREFGQHFVKKEIDGTSRLYAYNEQEIDLSRIGAFQSYYSSVFTKKCGSSHRVKIEVSEINLSYFEQLNSPHRYNNTHSNQINLNYSCHRNPLYAYIHEYSPMTSDPYNSGTSHQDFVMDMNENHSIIGVQAQAGYPYGEPISPNIDFSFTVHFHRLALNRYKVYAKGSHNLFPYYEMLIDGHLVYKYTSSFTGPNLFDLNLTHDFITKEYIIASSGRISVIGNKHKKLVNI